MAFTSEEILRRQEQDPNFQRFGFSAPVVPPQGTENPLLFSSSEGKSISQTNQEKLAVMSQQLEAGQQQLLVMQKTAGELQAKEAETKKAEDEKKVKEAAKAKKEADLAKSLAEPGEITPPEITPTPVKTKAEEDLETAETELKSYKNQLQQYTISDADLASQISNITSQWDVRIADTREINRRREATLQTMGIRTGAERYSASFGGILSAEERAGVSKITELEGQKQAAILAAKQAQKTQNWTVLNKQIALAEDFYNKKAEEVKKLNEKNTEEKKKLDEEKANLNLQENVRKVFDMGLDNASDIQAFLKENGIKADLEKVEKYLKIIRPPDSLAGLDADFKTAKYLIDNKYPEVEGMSVFEVMTMLENATRAPKELTGDVGQFYQVYGRTPKANELFEFQRKQAEAKREPEKGGLVSTPENQALIDAFQSAFLGLPKAQMEQAQNTFQSLLNRKDIAGAKNYIIRTAMAGAGVDQQNQAIGRKQALDTMIILKDLLGRLPTNLITGTIEKIAQKVGVSSNPDLAYIGSQIQQQIQVYRRAMTGVAFNPSESVEYGKIFPDITNIGTLNSAKIDSLIDSFNRNNRSALSFFIGDTNYDKIFGEYETPLLPSSRISDEELKKEYDEYLKQQTQFSPTSSMSTTPIIINENPSGFFSNFLKVFRF